EKGPDTFSSRPRSHRWNSEVWCQMSPNKADSPTRRHAGWLSKFFVFFAIFAVGGTLSWSPSVVVHFLSGIDFSSFEVRILSIAMPAVAIAVSVLVQCVMRDRVVRAISPLVIGLGIWVLGPTVMFVSFIPCEGGFTKSGAFGDL